MTLSKRLQAGAAALACTAALATASAAAPAALSPDDARRYAAAFDAADRGDFIEAQMQAVEIKDTALLGYLSFIQLMHPTAHRASFDELSNWLGRFRDLPLADRIFALAARRKPADAPAPPAPVVTGLAEVSTAADTTERGRRAREAYYAGDLRRALALAPDAGERWIAGLAALRLRSYAQARSFMGQLARDAGEDPWLRSAAAYWASRAAQALGDGPGATAELRLAAQGADTFYGMIAARRLSQQSAENDADRIGALIRASYAPTASDTDDFVTRDVRAHRAAALAQIGHLQEAGEELRAGLALCRSAAERRRWSALALEIGASPTARAPAPPARSRLRTIRCRRWPRARASPSTRPWSMRSCARKAGSIRWRCRRSGRSA